MSRTMTLDAIRPVDLRPFMARPDPAEQALRLALQAFNDRPSDATLCALEAAAIRCGMDPQYHGQGSVAAWAARHLVEHHSPEAA